MKVMATPVEIEFTGLAINPTVTNLTTGELMKLTLTDANDAGNIHSLGDGIKINGQNAFHYIDLIAL